MEVEKREQKDERKGGGMKKEERIVHKWGEGVIWLVNNRGGDVGRGDRVGR